METHALRIGPNELHLDDVSLYKTIYNQNTKYLKAPSYYDAFSSHQTMFGQYDPQLHRRRRKLMSPMFSRAGIFKLEGLIHDKYELMEGKILRLCGKGSGSVDAYDAFGALTTEIIAQFAFSRPAGMIAESRDSFKASSVDAIEGTADGIEHMRQYWVLRVLAAIMPRRLMARFGGDVGQFMHVLDYAEESVHHWEQHKGEVDHPVVFDALEGLADEQKSGEAVSMIIAGGDTTASTLTYAVAAVTGDPQIHQRLVSELETALAARGGRRGDRPALSELEEIPYLMAVVRESVRCAVAQPARLPRTVPDGGEPLIVDGKVIPPGTVVGMSTYTMNMSEEIFGPDARQFNPERWMKPESKQLAEHIYTFSKGSRMCIGINLANAELVILIASLFYNLKVSRPCHFQEPVEREHFTVS
ncbi:hypothetical protein INS49_009100 [Diaporthe citri]|uniref:uncharacterized protein n=1 Tax=Diaporthe citri TaxID=83186 RepID=UPI001C801CD2|nr:uncharacterized protein INS49_009100 [Diaporthe citri]KAG6363997.1 hypothetical protein INS49_009100 [Diaporthe citri]